MFLRYYGAKHHRQIYTKIRIAKYVFYERDGGGAAMLCTPL